jgi:4-amino-4-deoxy-L-arabinose transferase-like glycosyltransferase
MDETPRLRFGLVVLVLAAAGLMFYGLGDRDLWSSHEARAAMDAESLLRPGSDGVPRLHDGRLEMQKPPLFYWLVAGLAWMRGGVDELAVRLPAALSAAGVLLVVALGLGVGLRRPVAGLLAALVLATGIHFPWLARIGRIDMPLTFAVTAAGMAFVLAMFRRSVSAERAPANPVRLALTLRPTLMIAYAACAVGVLLKGPIGLALPGAIVIALLLAERRWSAWRELRPFQGLLLVVVIVAPVYLWLEHVSQGQFGREFLWHHNVERGLGGSKLRSHPAWLYLPYLLLYLLPWSLLLPLAAMSCSPLPCTRGRGEGVDPVARAGLAWLLGVVVLLSLSRFKRADYLLPAYPGAAILLGCWLERLLATAWRRPVLVGVACTAALMVAGWGVRIVVFLPREETYRDYRPFAALIREKADDASVVFFRAEAHTLAFRVGQPLEQVVEWPRLSERLKEPGPHWLVTPSKTVAEMRERLANVELEEVRRIADLAGGSHERPLVLLRATPRETHADPATAASDRRPADQRRAAAP